MDPPLKARDAKEKDKGKKNNELIVSVKEEEMETVCWNKLELIVSVKEERIRQRTRRRSTGNSSHCPGQGGEDEACGLEDC